MDDSDVISIINLFINQPEVYPPFSHYSHGRTLNDAKSSFLNFYFGIEVLTKLSRSMERVGWKEVKQYLIDYGINPDIYEEWRRLRNMIAHGEYVGVTPKLQDSRRQIGSFLKKRLHHHLKDIYIDRYYL